MILTLVPTALAHVPVVYTASPTDDWCAVIAGAEGGDIILLMPGLYTGACTITGLQADFPGELTTVASFDPADRAVLTWDGVSPYLLQLEGQLVVLGELDFAGTPAGVDAVRIRNARDLTVRDVVFTSIDGVGVRIAEGAERTTVRSNTFTGGTGVAIALGCPDIACAPSHSTVEGNLVTDVRSAVTVEPGIGAAIFDNVVTGAEVGMDIAGGGPLVEVTSNLVEAGGVGLRIGGGHAWIRSNLLVGNAGLESQGAALHDIRIVSNTIDAATPLTLSWTAGSGLELVNNALAGPLPALPGSVGAAGNVDCTDRPACWLDPGGWDWWPTASSPLRTEGSAAPEGIPNVDWCGRYRQDPPTVGAHEAFNLSGIGPLAPVLKESLSCTLLEDPTAPTTTPTLPSTDGGPVLAEPVPVPEPQRCACGTPAPGAGWVLWVGALSLGLTRRRPAPGAGQAR